MKSNLLKLPGLVDVHVHLREPGGTQKEDFETGTKAAVAGGFTQILDMPNNIPPTVTVTAINDKIKRAKGRIWCDLGFNFGANSDSIKYFNQIKTNVFGLKVYMNQTTGTLLVEKSKDRENIFKTWTSALPIMVHAMGKTLEDAIVLAYKYKKAIHVCHVTADQIIPIKKAKSKGLNITCEVCPHHLFLDKNIIKKIGNLGLMQPSLMEKQDQEKLWANIDQIDMISTDHAPHTLEEKYDQSSPKFGVPGLETALPLMLSAVDKGLLTFERLIAMMSTNPKKIFNLPDQPNTHVEVDLSKKYQISNKGLFTKCGWTPFKDMNAGGKVVKVMIRGKTVFENNIFKGNPLGKVIYPVLEEMNREYV